jgi:hypothetical protein
VVAPIDGDSSCSAMCQEHASKNCMVQDPAHTVEAWLSAAGRVLSEGDLTMRCQLSKRGAALRGSRFLQTGHLDDVRVQRAQPVVQDLAHDVLCNPRAPLHKLDRHLQQRAPSLVRAL